MEEQSLKLRKSEENAKNEKNDGNFEGNFDGKIRVGDVAKLGQKSGKVGEVRRVKFGSNARLKMKYEENGYFAQNHSDRREEIKQKLARNYEYEGDPFEKYFRDKAKFEEEKKKCEFSKYTGREDKEKLERGDKILSGEPMFKNKQASMKSLVDYSRQARVGRCTEILKGKIQEKLKTEQRIEKEQLSEVGVG